MKIHHEGYRLIAFFSILALLAALAIYLWAPIPLSFKTVAWALLAYFVVFILRFFRYPHREHRRNERQVMAPADGKVVVIEEVDEAEYFGDRRIQVSIFMSPYDVHINWVPLSGKVSYQRYFPGRYLVAWHPKSSLENERTSVVLTNEQGEAVLVRQIAGAVARRVVCYAREGVRMEQGSELGFIKFGSRVDLLLPPGARVEVGLNERVRGRETVIATLGE
ncbi:MAG TPA: phosphatidylserine decarboxylase family protein [Bacteroidales bacterium]|nr:phosphatidylserine decarboxylase family protein [Bacteroidales bacterium]HRZ76082.1 phosphatidylserine decarboxylase family protein [Bacteroidales bacterium]